MAKRWWWCVLDLTNRSFIRSFMISDPATRFGCVPGFHSRIREAPKQASKVRQRFVETHRAGHEAGGEDQDRQRKIILPTTVRPCPPPSGGLYLDSLWCRVKEAKVQETKADMRDLQKYQQQQIIKAPPVSVAKSPAKVKVLAAPAKMEISEH